VLASMQQCTLPFFEMEEIQNAASQDSLLICVGLELRHSNTDRKTEQLDLASAQDDDSGDPILVLMRSFPWCMCS
jgi:hypothetical protein